MMGSVLCRPEILINGAKFARHMTAHLHFKPTGLTGRGGCSARDGLLTIAILAWILFIVIFDDLTINNLFDCNPVKAYKFSTNCGGRRKDETATRIRSQHLEDPMSNCFRGIDNRHQQIITFDEGHLHTTCASEQWMPVRTLNHRDLESIGCRITKEYDDDVKRTP